MGIPAVGELIAERYLVEAPIGEGANAGVYRAQDTTLVRPVAIKFLFVRDERQQQWFADHFLREARLAARVRHPNVVHTIDFGTHGDRAYMVMELLEGSTLAHRLDCDPPLTPTQVVDVALQLLGGLSAVHEAGIVHRDLKPENVFLVSQGGGWYPKIVDFGVARVVQGDGEVRSALTTREGLIVGTPEYMSPEQARGLKEVDLRTDLYSIGVMIYEMLTGRLPFTSPNMGDLIVMIVSGGAPTVAQLRADLPPMLSAFCEQAMALRADERFQDARGMAVALRSAGGETHAPAAGRTGSTIVEYIPELMAKISRKDSVGRDGTMPLEMPSNVPDAAKADTVASQPQPGAPEAARATDTSSLELEREMGLQSLEIRAPQSDAPADPPAAVAAAAAPGVARPPPRPAPPTAGASPGAWADGVVPAQPPEDAPHPHPARPAGTAGAVQFAPLEIEPVATMTEAQEHNAQLNTLGAQDARTPHDHRVQLEVDVQQMPVNRGRRNGRVSEVPRTGVVHRGRQQVVSGVWTTMAILIAFICGGTYYVWTSSARLSHSLTALMGRALPGVAELMPGRTVTVSLVGVPTRATIKLDGTPTQQTTFSFERDATIHHIEVLAGGRGWSASFEATQDATLYVAME